MPENKVLRFCLWLVSCAIVLGFYFKSDVSGEIFAIGYIVGGHHVSPWGVLFLCLLWLFLKRSEVKENLSKPFFPVFVAAGLGVVLLSALIPLTPDFVVLKALVVCLGLFTVFFGRASLLPAKLLAVYAFTILMPMGVQTYLERPYALAAVGPAVFIARMLGLPVTADEQVLTVDTLSGESISVVVTAACAGPSTMAVFVAIFVLMMLDIRLPRKAAAGVFVFGAAGTWAQSVIRIVIIMASGHYGGASALWKAHFWTIYILFPLWYLIFAAVYFRVVNKISPAPDRRSPRRAG